jgi:hypothetical protein
MSNLVTWHSKRRQLVAFSRLLQWAGNPDFYNQYKLKKQMKTETQTDSSEKVPEDQSPQSCPPSDSLIS